MSESGCSARLNLIRTSGLAKCQGVDDQARAQVRRRRPSQGPLPWHWPCLNISLLLYFQSNLLTLYTDN